MKLKTEKDAKSDKLESSEIVSESLGRGGRAKNNFSPSCFSVGAIKKRSSREKRFQRYQLLLIFIVGVIVNEKRATNVSHMPVTSLPSLV
jgi:hypothetical protein